MSVIAGNEERARVRVLRVTPVELNCRLGKEGLGKRELAVASCIKESTLHSSRAQGVP